MRAAIIQDTHGQWFVRRLSHSVHDEPLAGPFADVIDAAHWVEDNDDEDDGGASNVLAGDDAICDGGAE